MPELFNYKLWNPNLGQFVAQADKRPAAEINELGGVIILNGGHPMSASKPEHTEARLPAPERSKELTAH